MHSNPFWIWDISIMFTSFAFLYIWCCSELCCRILIFASRFSLQCVAVCCSSVIQFGAVCYTLTPSYLHVSFRNSSWNYLPDFQIGDPKVPKTSGQPRTKVDSWWGQMSGGSIATTFLNTTSRASTCSPLTQIQKLVRLKHWKSALGSACT